MLLALGLIASIGVGGFTSLSTNGARATERPTTIEAAAMIHPDLGYDGKAILADGKVTQDEYVAAVLAARDCSIAEGLRISEARWESSGRFVYELGGYDTREELTQASPAFNRCNEAYIGGIDTVWRNSLPQNQYR